MSNQVQVRITGLVMTSRYGTLSTGALLRTDAAFAQHLVEECHAAEYTTAVVDAKTAVKPKLDKTSQPSADQ